MRFLLTIKGNILKYIVLIFLYIILYSSPTKSEETFGMDIFFINETQDNVPFPDESMYMQVKNTATWQDTYGDYGILNCLFNVLLGKNNENPRLEGYCNGKNQREEKFWLRFERNTEDFDAGIGNTVFIFGTGKYKNYVGKKCTYAVKLLDETAFTKHKCQ